MQNEGMSNNATLTVRLPVALKEQLEARAVAEHRSLSSQVVAELQRVAEKVPADAPRKGRVLGICAGGKVPTDEDIAEVRELLWRRLRPPFESDAG